MSRARAVPRILARRGDLVVERDPRRPSGRLLRCGDMDASYVDLADPGHLEFDYLRWMRKVLGAARARRVLHVGGGACALARTLAAADPGGRQEVCEIDPHVLALAREHCGLRRAPGLHVRQADGRAFIAVQPDASWDAVVIDAFVGAVLPPRLITAQALLDVARVARLALVNVVDDRPAHVVRAVAGGLAAAYPRVWGLGARAGNNTVVVGCAADLDLDLDRIAADAAADPSPARLTAPAAMTRLMSGSPALRDEGLTALAASAPRTLTAPAASAPRTLTAPAAGAPRTLTAPAAGAPRTTNVKTRAGPPGPIQVVDAPDSAPSPANASSRQRSR